MNQEERNLRERNRLTIQRTLGAVDGVLDLDELYIRGAIFKEPFFFPGRIVELNPVNRKNEPTERAKNQRIFDQWTVSDVKIYDMLDPNEYWATCSGTGLVLREDGSYAPYANAYVFHYIMEDGLVKEYSEYADPRNLLKGFGLPVAELPTPEETAVRYKERGLLD